MMDQNGDEQAMDRKDATLLTGVAGGTETRNEVLYFNALVHATNRADLSAAARRNRVASLVTYLRVVGETASRRFEEGKQRLAA